MAWEAIEYFTYLADLVYCSLLSIWYWYPLPYYWSPDFVSPMPGRSNL